ncbi:hypothetical protein KKC1_06790, partial [Calderihabitans maritimus]
SPPPSLPLPLLFPHGTDYPCPCPLSNSIYGVRNPIHQPAKGNIFP